MSKHIAPVAKMTHMTRSRIAKGILVHLLFHGNDKTGNIAGALDRPGPSVSRSMRALREQGLVEPMGGGVYRLTDEGRERALDLVENPFEQE